MDLYARRTFKRQDWFNEEVIKDVEMTSFSYVDSIGLTHTQEETYIISNVFGIEGKIYIPETSLNIPLFNLVTDPLFQYHNAFLPGFNTVNEAQSIYMISKTKDQLVQNWIKYFDEVIERMNKYAELFTNKRNIWKIGKSGIDE